MNCPICDKPTVWKDNPFRPFCSERCKLIDFGNWADENYSVPAEGGAISLEMLEDEEGTATTDDREERLN